MIGMGMRLKRPFDVPALVRSGFENGIDRARIDSAAIVIVIENRIDDGRAPGGTVFVGSSKKARITVVA
jgi:hypothetical protein